MLGLRAMTRRRWIGFFLGAAVLAAAPVALTLAPRTVAACSVVGPPLALKGFPEDGAVDVPTDVRPFFDSLAGRLYDPVGQAATFTLTSDGGDGVPVLVRQTYDWTFELLPATELAPRSLYTLEGRWMNANDGSQIALSLVFTTGAGPLAVAPSPPRASMAHYALPPPRSTCDPAPHGTCVSLPPGTTVEQTYIDSFGQDQPFGDDPQPRGALQTQSFMIDLSGVDQGTNFVCAKLRTRAVNGAVSDAVVLCGRDAPTIRYPTATAIACTPDGLVARNADGSLATAQTGACSVSPNPGGSGWLSLLATAGLASLALTVRRRPPRKT